MSVKQFSEDFLSHYFWHKDGDATPWLGSGTIYNGKITTVAAAGNYNETNRTSALVEALADAKKVLIKPPNGAVSLELRFRSDGSADDNNVIQLFAAAGADHYIHMAQLTTQQGAQIDTGSIYFADAITPANEIWLTSNSELSTTDDYIGRYVFNRHGYDRFWIIASTLATTTLYVDWKIL